MQSGSLLEMTAVKNPIFGLLGTGWNEILGNVCHQTVSYLHHCVFVVDPLDMRLASRLMTEKGEWMHAMNIYWDAVILYLNRLAYPHVPSAHSIFQREFRHKTYRLISLWHFKY